MPGIGVAGDLVLARSDAISRAVAALLARSSSSFFLASGDAHDLDGRADHVSGALLSARTFRHSGPPSVFRPWQANP